MKSFRQQVKEMKMWMIFYWLGIAVMFFALLFIGYTLVYSMHLIDLPQMSDKMLISSIEITLFSPILGGGLMVFSGIGIGRRKDVRSAVMC